MINYRVDDLHALLAALRVEGCQVEDRVDDSEYGKFGWVIDPDGNKVELWQPPEGPWVGRYAGSLAYIDGLEEAIRIPFLRTAVAIFANSFFLLACGQVAQLRYRCGDRRAAIAQRFFTGSALTAQ